MSKRKATPESDVRLIHHSGPDELGQKAKRHGLLIRRYSDGSVRFREPGIGFDDFPTAKLAEDYLDRLGDDRE